MGQHAIRRGIVVVVAALLAATACSEDRSGGADADEGGGTETTAAASVDCAGEDLVECARASSIGAVVPDEATAATGEPIVIGMINQEDTPVGSFPELSRSARAAVDFVNEQLGGIGGRPIELQVCNTKFSAEGSTACGQQFVAAGAPVVLGGIDVFGNGVDVLAENEVPYVGGIPVSTQSVKSPNSFQWSGGTWGAVIAFASHAATELDATSVAIVYGDFGSVSDAAEYGRRTLEELGVDDVQMVPYPIVATDLSSPVQAAATGDPDAIMMLVADTGCAPAFEAVSAAALRAQPFYTGACAAPPIVERAGAERTDGALFNVEGPIDREDPTPDTQLYNSVLAEYSDGLDPIGAATVSFRAFMNLYVVMAELAADGGAEAVTPKAITDSLRAQVDTPSFMGHPYTCDGRQLEGLPAMCSPQQILGVMQDEELTQVGDWIDVGAIYGKG